MKEIISKKQLRDFGLFIGFGFPLLIGWLLPAIVGHRFRPWTLLIGLLAFIFGITSPRMLYYPYKSWIALVIFLDGLIAKLSLDLFS